MMRKKRKFGVFGALTLGLAALGLTATPEVNQSKTETETKKTITWLQGNLRIPLVRLLKEGRIGRVAVCGDVNGETHCESSNSCESLFPGATHCITELQSNYGSRIGKFWELATGNACEIDEDGIHPSALSPQAKCETISYDVRLLLQGMPTTPVTPSDKEGEQDIAAIATRILGDVWQGVNF